MMAAPERWKSTQVDGFFHDVKGTILIPLIMLTRDSVSKNAAITTDKLNGNVFMSFEKHYNDLNRYDNFSTQIGLKPSKKVIQIQVPDYVTVSYKCKVWTDKLEQMNNLTELFVAAEGTYWGDPNRFKFYAKYDSITSTTELPSGEDRKILNEFNIDIHAYLIKQAFNNATSTTTLGFDTTPKKLIMSETVITVAEMQKRLKDKNK